MKSTSTTEAEPFGPVIFSYTRAQALEDGEQVEVPRNVSQQAGIKHPVFLTRGVWAAVIEAGGTWEQCEEQGEILRLPGGQDVRGRLWDVVCMLRMACQQAGAASQLTFAVMVDEHGTGKPRKIELAAVCGPLDMDKPEPALTVLLPEED